MGCGGSKDELDYNTLSQAVIDEEKRKIQARRYQQISHQPNSQQQPQIRPHTYPPENSAATNGTINRNVPPDRGIGHGPTTAHRRVQEPASGRIQASSTPHVIDPTSPGPTNKSTPKRGFANDMRSVFTRSSNEEQLSSFVAPRFDKLTADMEFLRSAMNKNFLFSNLSERQWKTMLDAFEQVQYERDVEVAKQGEEEDYFFVVRQGYVHLEVDGVKGDQLGPGQSFGELALLYDSPRAASVISDSPSTLFRVDQKTFRYILQTQRELAEHDKKVLLQGVPFLRDLDETDLSRLAEAMIPRRFAAGELLAAKGDPADAFFILQEGKVRVTDFDAGQTKYQDHDLGPGDYFGESAMIREEQRMANFRGKTKGIALTIDKRLFQERIGDFSDLIHKSQDKKKLVSEGYCYQLTQVPQNVLEIHVVLMFTSAIQAAIKLIQNTYLTGASLARLASRIVDRTYDRNSTIAVEGSNTPAALYLVREGRVEFTRKDGRGHRIVGEGGYFGEDTLTADLSGTVDELTGTVGTTPYVKSVFTISVMENATRLGILTLEECRFVIDTTKIGLGKRTDFTSIVDEDIPLKSLKKHGILGVGAFGQVWLVSKVAPDGTNRPYALKIQSKYELISRNQAKGVIRERNILAQLRSPFIIRLVQTYHDSSFVCMLLGLVQGGELFDMIYTNGHHGIKEEHAKFYAAGILEGLAYMHRRQIVYRDLKPGAFSDDLKMHSVGRSDFYLPLSCRIENILIAYGGYPVIIDLGFAKIVETKTYTPCGTPLYIAPEVMLNQGHNISADHWSFGILLYEMIAGHTPFYTKDMDRITLYRSVVKGAYGFPENKFSQTAKDFIRKIIIVDPRKRLGSLAAGSDDFFRDPWFSSIDFTALRRREIEAPWIPTIKDPFDMSKFKKADHIQPKTTESYPIVSSQFQDIFRDF